MFYMTTKSHICHMLESKSLRSQMKKNRRIARRFKRVQNFLYSNSVKKHLLKIVAVATISILISFIASIIFNF